MKMKLNNEEIAAIFTALRDPERFKIIEWLGDHGGLIKGRRKVLYGPLAKYLKDNGLDPRVLGYVLTRLKDDFMILEKAPMGEWRLSERGWRAYFLIKLYGKVISVKFDYTKDEPEKVLRRIYEVIATETDTKDNS